MAAEHHGMVKSGGLPVPGATVTATKGDKKHTTTTDENGRYAFADLPDGAWTIEVEMLGFAKLSNEVGIAFDAPAPEWNLKFLPMSAITAPPRRRQRPTAAPARQAHGEPRRRLRQTPAAAPTAPKPPAAGSAGRGQPEMRPRRARTARAARRRRPTADGLAHWCRPTGTSAWT